MAWKAEGIASVIHINIMELCFYVTFKNKVFNSLSNPVSNTWKIAIKIDINIKKYIFEIAPEEWMNDFLVQKLSTTWSQFNYDKITFLYLFLSKYFLFYCFHFFIFGKYSVVLRDYSCLCTQEFVLPDKWREVYGMLEISPARPQAKQMLYPCPIAPTWVVNFEMVGFVFHNPQRGKGSPYLQTG